MHDDKQKEQIRAATPNGGDKFTHSNINEQIEPAWELRSEGKESPGTYKGFPKHVLDRLNRSGLK